MQKNNHSVAHHSSNETCVIDSPIGHLKIETHNNQLIRIELNSSDKLRPPISELTREIERQIGCYFDDPTYRFKIHLDAKGTEYQKRIWNELSNISVGKIMTYGELAKKVDSGARAIGNACRNNPIPLIVPCHRIVSASGLGGFSGQLDGQLINIKQTLLVHEKALLI